MKNCFNNLKKILIMAMIMLAILCFSACAKAKTITAQINYTVVAVGQTVELPKLNAVDEKGKTYETEVSVFAPSGEAVEFTEGKFVATKEGRYIAKYSTKKSNVFEYYVYAFSDGKEYGFLTDEFNPQEEAEWNTSVSFSALTVKNRVSGQTTEVTPKVIFDGKEIQVNENAFTPTALGDYTVKYAHEGAEYSYTLTCVCTKQPTVEIKNTESISVEYGEEALLPYYEVIYPEELIQNVTVSVFKYGDKTDSAEIVGTNSNRFLVTTARNYLYTITVEYLGSDGTVKTTECEFLIEREYDDTLDRIDVYLEGDTVKWLDRNQVVDQKLGENDYYQVTGYEVSVDGGTTFTDCSGLSYKIDDAKFTQVIVREKRSYSGDKNSKNLVAVSNPIYYDGESAEYVVSSFNDPLYMNTVSYNSFKGWIDDNINSMEYSIATEVDGKTGILQMTTRSWTGMKIDFTKTHVLKTGDVIGMTLKFVPSVVDDQKHDFDNSNIFVVGYGRDGEADYPHVIGYNLKNAGLVANQWCTVYFDAQEVLGQAVGETIKGLELCVIIGGTVYVDEICYYASEEYNTFDNVYTLGQVGYSGAKYDESVPNPQEDVKNRYYYFAKEDSQGRTLQIIEAGYEQSKSGVLKFSYDLYGSIGIKLSKSKVVTENLLIDVVYYYSPLNDKHFSVSKYGTDDLGKDLTANAKTGMWTHMLISPVKDLGYSVNDVIDGIDLYLSMAGGEFYVDEIKCFEQTPLADGMVASFNYEYYSSNLVAPGAKWSEGQDEQSQLKNVYVYYFNNDDVNNNVERVKYSIDENGYSGSDGGVLKIDYDIRGSLGIAFMESATVTENTVISIRIFMVYTDGYLYVNKFKEDSLGVKKDSLTYYEWIDVEVKATDLGYAVGETLEGVDLYFGEYDGTVYVDYIKIIEK